MSDRLNPVLFLIGGIYDRGNEFFNPVYGKHQIILDVLDQDI